MSKKMTPYMAHQATHGVAFVPLTQFPLAQTPVAKTGTYKGKSNKLGFGGRSQQLKDKGVPGGVIGALARASQSAPGQKNYHGKKA